jgi:hypothetical protein
MKNGFRFKQSAKMVSNYNVQSLKYGFPNLGFETNVTFA